MWAPVRHGWIFWLLDASTLSDNSMQTRCSWTVLKINLLRFFVTQRPPTSWDRFDMRFNWFDVEVFFSRPNQVPKDNPCDRWFLCSFSICKFGITRFFVPFYWNSIKWIGFSVKLKPTNRHKMRDSFFLC